MDQECINKVNTSLMDEALKPLQLFKGTFDLNKAQQFCTSIFYLKFRSL